MAAYNRGSVNELMDGWTGGRMDEYKNRFRSNTGVFSQPNGIFGKYYSIDIKTSEIMPDLIKIQSVSR